MHGQRQEKPAVTGFCGALPCLHTVIHRPKGTASVKDGEHVVGFAVNELLDPQQVVSDLDLQLVAVLQGRNKAQVFARFRVKDAGIDHGPSGRQ